jgi:hypothetical protein
VRPARRRLIVAGGALALAQALSPMTGSAKAETSMTILDPPLVPGVTLATAPIELAGSWGRMIPHSADEVVELMRHACLNGVRLLSDRQPTRLRVDEHTSGPPSVWLHPDGSTTAWVIVDIGERAWSQLAYQFGHELGHVFANSWQPHARPRGPTQWLEEALVEAFSLRGLGRLGPAWKRSPPFPNDNAYGDAVLAYRRNVVADYARLAAGQGGLGDLAAWFHRYRPAVEGGGGLNEYAKAVAAMAILPEYEREPGCVEGVGALNRWPDRSGLPIEAYLRQWEASCRELGASGVLPAYLARRLGVG